MISKGKRALETGMWGASCTQDRRMLLCLLTGHLSLSLSPAWPDAVSKLRRLFCFFPIHRSPSPPDLFMLCLIYMFQCGVQSCILFLLIHSIWKHVNVLSSFILCWVLIWKFMFLFYIYCLFSCLHKHFFLFILIPSLIFHFVKKKCIYTASSKCGLRV